MAVHKCNTIKLDRERPINFGINQTILFCDEFQIDLPEATELIQKSFTGKSLKGLVTLIYTALIDGCRLIDQEKDFTKEDVGDWLDYIEADEMVKILNIYTKSMPEGEGEKKKTNME